MSVAATLSLLWFSATTWLGFCMIIAPAVVLLLLTYGARRQYRGSHAAAWRATAWGLYAASLAFVGFTVYVFHAISVSRRSTALLGVVAIPFEGIPFSATVFLAVWSVAVLVLRWRAPRPIPLAPDAQVARGISNGAVAIAVLILVVGGAVYAANAYTMHLMSLSAQTSSPDGLRQLAHGTWARMDRRVLVAVARNESAPGDLIWQLSRDSDDVQTALAYNPRTPFEVMIEMSKTNWSAANNLAELGSRHAALVTPEVLRQLAAGRFALDTVAKNPKTPVDALENLSVVVPQWVAGNPKTPQDVLRNIFVAMTESDWSSYKVNIARRGLAANPSTPRDILDALSKSGTPAQPSARTEAATRRP